MWILLVSLVVASMYAALDFSGSTAIKHDNLAGDVCGAYASNLLNYASAYAKANPALTSSSVPHSSLSIPTSLRSSYYGSSSMVVMIDTGSAYIAINQTSSSCAKTDYAEVLEPSALFGSFQVGSSSVFNSQNGQVTVKSPPSLLSNHIYIIQQ